MAKVILKYNDVAVEEISIGKKIVTIGRSKDNNIVIDNLAVSRNHARIRIEGNTFFLDDLESANGTFINNRKIDRYELNHGDRISIGKHVLVFLKEFEIIDKGATSLIEDHTFLLDTKKHRDLVKRERDRKGK